MQATAHSQCLSDALQAQAKQLGAKWASQTEAKLIHQETLYQNELVKAMAGLRGIEAMVDTVASAGIDVMCTYVPSIIKKSSFGEKYWLMIW